MQDADESIPEGAQSLVVHVAGGAMLVVERFPPNRRGIDNEEHDAREADEV